MKKLTRCDMLSLVNERIPSMKKLFTLLVALSAMSCYAGVYRVAMTSSGNSGTVINSVDDPFIMAKYGSTELQTITVYDCTTNSVVTSSNKVYRVSSDKAVTNLLTTVEIDENKEFVTVVFNPTIPFAPGDYPLIVGNDTNMPFKVQGLFLSR